MDIDRLQGLGGKSGDNVKQWMVKTGLATSVDEGCTLGAAVASTRAAPLVICCLCYARPFFEKNPCSPVARANFFRTGRRSPARWGFATCMDSSSKSTTA